MAKENNMTLWIGVVVVLVILIGGYFVLGKGGAPTATTTVTSTNSTNGGGGTTTAKGTTTIAGTNATTTIQQIQPGIPLNLTLSEWAITPSVLTVKTGASIILKVKNAGQVSHNLQITAIGSTGDLLPGQSATLNFTAPVPGNYSMVDTKYLRYGMSGTLIVTK